MRTYSIAIVVIGDQDGHVGFGINIAKIVKLAIKGALIKAKLSLIPVKRDNLDNKIGNFHTIPNIVTGNFASLEVTLKPVPRGAGIFPALIFKKVL